MKNKIQAYNLFFNLYNSNYVFRKLIDANLKNKKIRFFNDEEWKKIEKQNFSIPNSNVNSFLDFFILGYNVGNCVSTTLQLSYSYDDVDIVSGILPFLKGCLNSELEGGHRWLETSQYIIDTSLMLIIDKSLKNQFGYIEEERLTKSQLLALKNYQIRKDFVNDKNIKRKK